MVKDMPLTLNDSQACVDQLIQRVGKDITLGLPLGLGKPIRFVNALYERAQADPGINLHIVTALSLTPPGGSSTLEKRFMEPFVERLYGDIPELDYARDVIRKRLPPNVTVSEFFFKAGAFLNDATQQRRYVCTNYTHAVRDLMDLGVNVLAQLVAPPTKAGDKGLLSLSCNPDLTLDLMPLLRQREADGNVVAIVGELNRHLPFLGNSAAISDSQFDLLLEHPRSDYPLFSAPQMAISPEDHLIGFYASTLLKDGGTLQVGIGSLGSALVHNAILRHQHNAHWKAVYDQLAVAANFPVVESLGGVDPFEKGLYGCSEMMVDGFIHLLEAGVIHREVYNNAELQELINQGRIEPDVSLDTLDVLHAEDLIDSPLRARDVALLRGYGIFRSDVEYKGGRLRIGEQSLEPDLDAKASREAISALALGKKLTGGIVIHGGFYVGPASFYQKLRDLSPEDRQRISMTSVNFINHLYDHAFGNQRLKAAQRAHSRFINTAMMHTLNGAAVSDGLEDGRVVSGVGGQYNFVAMAHELPGARSIICLRSTRKSGHKTVSNLVFNYGHCTIPRHLRDIVITEYGIADLRGQPDEQVYLRLIRIADSRFQESLLAQAKKAGKVDPAFQMPLGWRNNTPERIKSLVQSAGGGDVFPAFPFGCDFTDQELTLGKALKGLKAATATRRGKMAALWRAIKASDEQGRYASLLQRMNLDNPKGLRETLDQKLLIHGLDLIQTPSNTGNQPT
ncbi:acetyl-CoA hydrolase/transferase C-terminal domain-containing protein [Marinobacter sp. CHS3-4]|uniref:acetyl-CoA hydrolase/transferase C-terminal domain-containing protein n=1 Tax=Marinobacter sp. CHS3-4 TaxID=3045174 RepID=UPI0024B5CFDD|nr:acetyl-CoA hydrolase/transferase C-terminal domain-containing protein [Marinobacter sp. CHS3-4]MDI9246158.1 acetyl-CoA hydrolase/transferase C-terminal domain-containing protein [Marinobacter sp. CHS3-4]